MTENSYKCENWYNFISLFSEELIDNSKKVLHELYCLRNLFKCSCGEIVDKKEEVFHKSQMHVEASCKYCNIKLEAWELENHHCEQTPKTCPYCGIMIKGTEFDPHITLCGSKTELCSQCHQYVAKKEWLSHMQNSCNIPEEIVAYFHN